jgi:hypothetical protein
MGLAANLRDFWDDLFYSELVQRLEQDLMLLRSDMQQLRQDKDSVIADLRAEKALIGAKNLLYEQNINARVGIDPTRKREKPNFVSFNTPPVKTSWQVEVEAHDAQNAKELAEEETAAEAAKK